MEHHDFGFRMQGGTGFRGFCKFELATEQGVGEVFCTCEQLAPGGTCEEYLDLYGGFSALHKKFLSANFVETQQQLAMLRVGSIAQEHLVFFT